MIGRLRRRYFREVEFRNAMRVFHLADDALSNCQSLYSTQQTDHVDCVIVAIELEKWNALVLALEWMDTVQEVIDRET